MTVSVSAAGSEPAVVTIRGELDLSNSDAVRTRLDEVALASLRVILDLQTLEFIDSTGLSTIVRLGKQLKERGGQLAVVVTKPSIRKLFSITALDKRFPLFETAEDVRF
ncbi:MAG: STAS domain-containing protein [Candidatus Eremiobacteraeota bacterium]|nr:STAS domain-containing protein [Candidatus Eremiobacteraeota bacterium]